VDPFEVDFKTSADLRSIRILPSISSFPSYKNITFPLAVASGKSVFLKEITVHALRTCSNTPMLVSHSLILFLVLTCFGIESLLCFIKEEVVVLFFCLRVSVFWFVFQTRRICF